MGAWPCRSGWHGHPRRSYVRIQTWWGGKFVLRLDKVTEMASPLRRPIEIVLKSEDPPREGRGSRGLEEGRRSGSNPYHGRGDGPVSSVQRLLTVTNVRTESSRFGVAEGPADPCPRRDHGPPDRHPCAGEIMSAIAKRRARTPSVWHGNAQGGMAHPRIIPAHRAQ